MATEQEGARPSRTVYQITDDGRAEFMRLLREVWSDVERHYFVFDVGLFFKDALSIEEVAGYLRDRVAHLEAILEHLDAHQAEQMAVPGVPLQAVVIFNHSRVHFDAELGWTRDLLETVERGEFP